MNVPALSPTSKLKWRQQQNSYYATFKGAQKRTGKKRATSNEVVQGQAPSFFDQYSEFGDKSPSCLVTSNGAKKSNTAISKNNSRGTKNFLNVKSRLAPIKHAKAQQRKEHRREEDSRRKIQDEQDIENLNANYPGFERSSLHPLFMKTHMDYGKATHLSQSSVKLQQMQ